MVTDSGRIEVSLETNRLFVYWGKSKDESSPPNLTTDGMLDETLLAENPLFELIRGVLAAIANPKNARSHIPYAFGPKELPVGSLNEDGEIYDLMKLRSWPDDSWPAEVENVSTGRSFLGGHAVLLQIAMPKNRPRVIYVGPFSNPYRVN